MFAYKSYLPSRLASTSRIYLLNSGLVLLLAVSGVQWYRHFQAQPGNGRSSLQASPAIHQDASRPSLDLLLSRPIFGVKKQAVEEDRLENIPLSSLDLQLTGVVAGDRGGIALISIGAQPQVPFFIGEVVAPYTVLDAVLPDRVILQRSGVRESLVLKTDKTAPGDSGAIAPPSRPALNTTPKSAPIYGNIRKETRAKYALSESANQETVRPVTITPGPGGVGAGFVVMNVLPGSIYEKMGLKKGDKVETLNGVSIKSMADAMKFHQTTANIKDLKGINVGIRRAGKQLHLRYP